MSKYLLISSTKTGPFFKKTCVACKSHLVVSSLEEHCPNCWTDLPEDGERVPETVEASTGKKGKPVLVCAGCEKQLVVRGHGNTPVEMLANTLYCPVCGGGDLDVFDPETDTDNMDAQNEVASGELDNSDTDNEGEEVTNPEDAGDDTVVEDEGDDEGETAPVEDEVQDKITGSDLTNIEASLLTKPEQAWLITSSGKPLVKILKSKTDVSAHAMFATEGFVNIFLDRVSDVGLTSAVKEFGGEVFDNKDTLNHLDIETLAFDKIKSHVLPKFIDCLALAVEGASKGVYPDLNTALKAEFVDEITSRGVSTEDAVEIVESSFKAAGTDVFAALISKAQDLYTKSEGSFKEIKATIQASGYITSSKVSDNFEKKELRSRLLAGNMPIMSTPESITASTKESFKTQTVGNFRERIQLRAKVQN